MSNRDYNSMELDPDIIMLYLYQGKRDPQNDYERGLLAEIKEMKKKEWQLSFLLTKNNDDLCKMN